MNPTAPTPQLGIFARVFPTQPAATLAATIHNLNLHSVQ